MFVKTQSDIELELMVYERIEYSGITPEVLALIEDDHSSELVGFVMEHIDGKKPTSQSDLQLCLEVLEKFHQEGYAHCDADPSNFIVAHGRAYLIDLHSAVKFTDNLGKADIELLKEYF